MTKEATAGPTAYAALLAAATGAGATVLEVVVLLEAGGGPEAAGGPEAGV